MRHSWRVALAAVVLAACTGKSPEPLPKYPDASAYCSGRAQAECNDAVIAACAAPTKDKCILSRQGVCISGVPGGKAYDSSQTEDCIARVSSAYGDAKLTKDEIKTYTDACALLFNGVGVKNSPCAADGDCKVSEGLRCVVSSSGGADGGAVKSSGNCQVPMTVQGGDSCAPVDAMCAAGYHCGLTKHCEINGAAGEACGDGSPCKETLKCSSAGMCEPKLPDSSPCTVGEECLNGVCLEQSNICVSQVILAPNEPFCVQAR
jgi:hypothetical protein